MKRLTNFGKRVMATLALIVVCILMGLGGFVAVWDKACKIGIDQQAFNVLFFVTVLPISCYCITVLVDIIRHGRLS